MDENGNLISKEKDLQDLKNIEQTVKVETPKIIEMEKEKIVANIMPQNPEAEIVLANKILPSQNQRHNKMMFPKSNELEQDTIKDFESSTPLLEKIKILEENNQSLNNRERARDILEPRAIRNKYAPSLMSYKRDKFEKQDDKTNDKTK